VILKTGVKTPLLTKEGQKSISAANTYAPRLKSSASLRFWRITAHPLVLGTKNSWCKSKRKLWPFLLIITILILPLLMTLTPAPQKP